MTRVLLLTLSLMLGAPAAAQQHHFMRAHYIDVDQGDATLLEFPCGAVLIDAGGRTQATDRRLRRYLDTVFARRTDLNRTIESVFITHTHADHNRALRGLVEEPTIAINNYVHNGILSGSGRHAANFMDAQAAAHGIMPFAVEDTAIVAEGDVGLTNAQIDPVACAGIDPEISVLSGRIRENPGWTAGAFEDGNNQSLVIRVDFGDASFLFTGDLEDEAIETLVDFYAGSGALDVDVYQVGHHGSEDGNTPSLMNAMTARLAILSVGRRSTGGHMTAAQHGHPRQLTVNELVAGVSRRRSRAKRVLVATGQNAFQSVMMRRAVYATGWDGTVVVHARSDGRLIVRTQR